MKKTLLIIAALFALLPLTTFTQDAKTVVDSSWIVNRSGLFYQARLQQFDNGKESLTYTPFGDTTKTTRSFTENIKAVSKSIADQAATASDFRQQITELIRFGKTLPGIIGTNPLDSILKLQPNLFDNSGWTLNTSSTSVGIRFRLNGQGALQWKADSTTNWRAAAFLGYTIRLNNLNGYTTDFHLNNKNRFQTINGQYTIRQPGDVAARRDVADLPEEPAPVAQPKTELLTGGLVRIGELIYKYNSRSKKWVLQK